MRAIRARFATRKVPQTPRVSPTIADHPYASPRRPQPRTLRHDQSLYVNRAHNINGWSTWDRGTSMHAPQALRHLYFKSFISRELSRATEA